MSKRSVGVFTIDLYSDQATACRNVSRSTIIISRSTIYPYLPYNTTPSSLPLARIIPVRYVDLQMRRSFCSPSPLFIKYGKLSTSLESTPIKNTAWCSLMGVQRRYDTRLSARGCYALSGGKNDKEGVKNAFQ